MDKEFADEQCHANDENDNPFHAGQSGDIAAEEIKHEGEHGDEARKNHAGSFDFDVDANKANGEQERADGIDPGAELFRTAGFDGGDLSVGISEFIKQSLERINSPG